MIMLEKYRTRGKAIGLGLALFVLASASVAPALAIEFGNNSSEWANDGECDDPRFGGDGMADVLLDEDIGRDATDCQRLLNKGRIFVLAGGGKTPGIDFGNNSSEWANDGECDDPRFSGPGSATTLLDVDLGRDANDCRSLLQQGQVQYVGEGGQSGGKNVGIDFGNNTSEWANDGECDDPRFGGPGVAAVLLDEDLGRDANDCRSLLANGQIYVLSGNSGNSGGGLGIDFGNNTSDWANDGECDDPRFSGPGSATTLLDVDRGRDANDCRSLFQQGQVQYVGEGGQSGGKNVGIDFGNNTSDWANDGECDDPRFSGPGSATTLLDEDRGRDANDCRSLFQQGLVQFVGAAGGLSALPCPDDATGLNQSGACSCTAVATNNAVSVWGTDIYTSDSGICRAALHAGQISTAGGTVFVNLLPGQASYYGSVRNGVSSSDWTSGWDSSFSF